MDAIISLIKVNEEIDYGRVVLIVLIYVAVLWLMVSVWAGRDAAKRYGTPWAGIVWGVAVFLLGFPAFMFFLVVRPEEGHDASTGGVHIPIANFVDTNRDEIVMGVQLVLHTKELTDAVRDMRIDIDWESSDSAKQITPESIGKEAAEVEKKITGLGNIYKSLKQRIDNSLEDAKVQGEKRRREREERQRQRQEDQKLKLEAAVAAAKAADADAKVKADAEAKAKSESDAKQKAQQAEADAKAVAATMDLVPAKSEVVEEPTHEQPAKSESVGSEGINTNVSNTESISTDAISSEVNSREDISSQSISEGDLAPLAQAKEVAQTLINSSNSQFESSAQDSTTQQEVTTEQEAKPQPHPAHDLFAGRRHKKKKRR